MLYDNKYLYSIGIKIGALIKAQMVGCGISIEGDMLIHV